MGRRAYFVHSNGSASYKNFGYKAQFTIDFLSQRLFVVSSATYACVTLKVIVVAHRDSY